MPKSNRPRFDLNAEAHIEAVQNQADNVLWADLTQWLCSTPTSRHSRSSNPLLNALSPPPAPRPAFLLSRITSYARTLYVAEGDLYEQSAQTETWLRKLAQRIVRRALDTVTAVERHGNQADLTLKYHGLTDARIRKAVSDVLNDLIDKRMTPALQPINPPETISPSRPKVFAPMPSEGPTEKSPIRKAVVEPILEEKGWSILDWANEANVAHATTMDYLQGKTKPYRSTRLKLAKALGVPIEKLPR